MLVFICYLKTFQGILPLKSGITFLSFLLPHLYFHDFKENGWVKSYKIPFDSTAGLSPL